MNFDPFEDASRTLRYFSMAYCKAYEWLSDLKAPFIELVYLILPNVEDVVENIKYWRQFFKGESISSKAPKYIHKARQLILFDNLTKEEQEMAETISKQQAIRNAENEYARRQGIREVALNLPKNNVDLTIVIQSTGLSEEEVKELENKQNNRPQ